MTGLFRLMPPIISPPPGRQLLENMVNNAGLNGFPVLVLAGQSIIFIAGLAALVAVGRRLLNTRRSFPCLFQRLKTRPWSLGAAVKLFLAIAAIECVQLLFVRAVSARLHVDPSELMPLSLILHTLVFDVIGIVLVAALLKSCNTTWRESFGFSAAGLRGSIVTGLYSYLALVPVVAVGQLLCYFIFFSLDYDLSPQPVVELLFDKTQPPVIRYYLITLAVIIAPVVEEVLFRGIALPALAKHFGPAASIIIVSLFFAAVHFHTESIIALSLLSVAFCVAYICTGTLAVPIVMHSLYNTVAVGTVLLTRSLT